MGMMYLFCQIVQLLTPIINELVNYNNLLAIDGRLLQLAHQRRDVSDLLIQRSPATLGRTHRPQCARSRKRGPNAKSLPK